MATRTFTKRPRAFHTPAALQAWGRRLAALLKPGDVVALVGDLGAGKTTLMQGVASGWGVRSEVTSPTFALVNEYPSSRGVLYHMDMYRLSPDELAQFPLEDYFDTAGVCVIEWGDRVRERWPQETLVLTLEKRSPKTRVLHWTNIPKDWASRLKPFNP